MSEIRRQLTLFLDYKYSFEIEKIRKQFNPIQYSLIKSHVTLCRDEELDEIVSVLKNLQDLNYLPIELAFGNVTRFSNGDGVMLASFGDVSAFEGLRKAILKNIISEPKELHPHITLMHPRNSKCNDEIFRIIKRHLFPETIYFNEISLVEQVKGGKWNIVDKFDLGQFNTLDA